MRTIEIEKIVRAVEGSARLEGYKGSLKVTATKKKEEEQEPREKPEPKATANR